ncbi:MAG: MBL fold metallo-hydrolase [Bacteroidota bacterium]|nr:MBL fold metallo-hydrolase [Bacteroidota bacterium]
MQLYTINAGYFKLDGGAMFGVVPKSIWSKLNPSDEHNMCNWALRCLLIESEGRLILVDNGMGDKQDSKFFSHYYLNGTDTLDGSLARHGFTREDITDVFLTHLHFDHCGGSIMRQGDQLVPAFPNAIFWSNEKHWQWAVTPNDREKASFLKENILPIRESGQLQFVDTTQGIEFARDFSIRFVNGHTESMMLPQLKYKGRTLVYMADLIPSLSHVPIPYVMAYDTRPLDTMVEKKEFLEEAVQGDYLLFFEHDPVVEVCSLQMTERGVRSKEVLRLEDF